MFLWILCAYLEGAGRLHRGGCRVGLTVGGEDEVYRDALFLFQFQLP